MNNQEVYNFDINLPFGVNGENLLIANYNGYTGVVSDISNGKYKILSVEKLNENSVVFRDAYVTELNFDDLNDLYQCALYANYKGNIYSVGLISKHAQEVELFARVDHSSEDLSLGFKYDMNLRLTHKLVPRSELTGLYYSKVSILENEKGKNISL